MGLFDRKYCDICGNKIGLLGNRKVEDGNLCKACASKLSPWFSERRHSTINEIRAQLDYRERNKAAVGAFHTTRIFGRGARLYLDEDARRFMVSDARDLIEANPDVIDCSLVTDCRLDVNEHRRELHRKDKDGHQVSYDPPRYEYSYDFYIVIQVNHPYFDEIRFKLNQSSVITGERSINDRRPGPRRPEEIAEAALGALLSAGQGMGNVPTWNAEYNEQLLLAEELRSTLMRLRREVRDEAAAQNTPKTPVKCPNCGATAVPDANGCCEYCGSRLNV